jgi:hypothetical protein
MISASTPAGSSPPAGSGPPTRIATPASPTAIPATASRGNRSPRNTRPRTATQTGIIAISSAAIPEGTVCSPHATRPIPPPRRRAPTTNMSRHSRPDGHAKPRPSRRIDQAKRARPAVRNRVAAMVNGGIVSTAIRMPRYVDPQTTYRTSSPNQSSALDGRGWADVGIAGWSKSRV